MTPMKIALATATFALGVASLVGCAGSIPIPADARVESMQTDKMVLRGEAAASVDNPSCQTNALPARHFVKLNEDLNGHFLVRPAAGESALKLAVLHITNLESGKSWCVQAGADGAPAMIGAEFPQGTYAVSVTEGRTSAPHRYELVVEKL
jgi:hypothetical protein